MSEKKQQNRLRNQNRFLVFKMMVSMFASIGKDTVESNKKAFHQVYMNGGNGEYITTKHPIMNYAKQNRIAKQKRKIRAKQPK